MWLRVLADEPRLAAILEDLTNAATERAAVYERRADRELVEELKAIRTEFAHRVPELDDSDSTMPDDGASQLRYEQSLAAFDAEVARDPNIRFPTMPTSDADPSRLESLIHMLDEKLRTARFGAIEPGVVESDVNLRPDLDDLFWRLGNVSRRHVHARRIFRADSRTLPGVSFARLSYMVEQLNPPPRMVNSREERLREMESHLLQWGATTALLRNALDGRMNHESGDAERFATAVETLKQESTRLHEELRRRLGTARSHLGLVRRFKARCEWHDRTRLARLAEATSQPEHALRDELTRYLFDAGLNPLSEAQLAGLRADVLQPVTPTMYVEAKQYTSPRRTYLRGGVHQLWDTVGALRGTPYDVREAFYVVFRRSGPRYVLPEFLHADGITVYLLLIDIGEASTRGSRQQHRPVLISEEELLPQPEDESSSEVGGQGDTS